MLSIDVIKIFIAIKKEFKEFVKIDLSNMEKFNNCEKIEEKPIQTYKCHVCNEEFDQYGLELHFMTNHVIEENVMSVCQNKEESGGINNVPCETKPKAKAIQKFKCSLCEKAYTQSQNLKLHVQYVHEGQKPRYKCDTCDKCFTQSHNLKSHINRVHKLSFEAQSKSPVHEGSKPQHKCDMCNKCFTQSHNLKSHINRVHKVANETQNVNHRLLVNFDTTNFNNLDNIPIPYIKEENMFNTQIHSIENPNQDATEKSSSGLEQFFVNNIDMEKKETCVICNKEFASAKDMMIHTSLEHLSETIQFANHTS